MGMFDKLFGEAVKAIEKVASDKTVDAAMETVKKVLSQDNRAAQNIEKQVPAASSGSRPSGFSWGDEMPAEENQYNYDGNYREYFEMIFREDFPELTVDKEIPAKFPKRTIYRFSRGGEVALVVELFSESSSAKKVREECSEQGIPYLRFYYDHDGWWNTRAYVDDRIRKAIG